MTSIVPKIGIRVIKDGCKVSSLKKWKDSKNRLSDYKIFMATSEKPGKDNSGNYIYLKNKDGDFVDEKGISIDTATTPRVVDHDLESISVAFEKFINTENINFHE